jgi:hypothetical protein
VKSLVSAIALCGLVTGVMAGLANGPVVAAIIPALISVVGGVVLLAGNSQMDHPHIAGAGGLLLKFMRWYCVALVIGIGCKICIRQIKVDVPSALLAEMKSNPNQDRSFELLRRYRYLSGFNISEADKMEILRWNVGSPIPESEPPLNDFSIISGYKKQ